MNENEGPQGLPPGLAGHQGIHRCCAFCTHFYKEPEGSQAGFYGSCRVLDTYGSDAFRQNNCSYFDSRPLEEIVAERLAGTWLGKYRD